MRQEAAAPDLLRMRGLPPADLPRLSSHGVRSMTRVTRPAVERVNNESSIEIEPAGCLVTSALTVPGLSHDSRFDVSLVESRS